MRRGATSRSPAPVPVPADGAVNQAAFSYYARLARVKEYVDSHYTEEVTLTVAAGIAGLEPKYFSAFFRDKTGVCFSDWLRQLRVEKALDLMRARNYSITEVAFEVGFQDLRTFERAFKRVTTMTPREFKRSVRPC